MKTYLVTGCASALLLGAAVWWTAAAEPPRTESVTVFPVVLNGGKPIEGVPDSLPRDLAAVIGLLLERGGLQNIELASAAFVPAENDDLTKTAAVFGEFVRLQAVSTQTALYGEFLGTPAAGVEELRLVLVDRQGEVLLCQRRDRQQLLSPGQSKLVPMLACQELVRQLQPRWGLADPQPSDAAEGPMARLWAEKSGIPPKNERDAMHSRRDLFKKTLKQGTLAVYPVLAGQRGDVRAGARLAESLREAKLGRILPVETELQLPLAPNTNQSRIVWDLARLFQAHLRQNPPAADYALLVDYRIGQSSDGKPAVGGVHFVLCDREGNWVLVGGRNSHHADFRRVNPQSADDCHRLIAEILGQEFR